MVSHGLRNAALSLATLSILAGVGPGQGSSFKAGDIYLLTSAYGGPAAWDARLMRLDPWTGQATTLVDCWAISQSARPAAYDPFRDRIVFVADVTGTGVSRLHTVDGTGATQPLGPAGQSVANLCPASGGRIYFQNSAANTQQIYYLDAANAEHTLMVTGPSGQPIPFWLNPGSGINISGMIHHPGLNALFCATASFNGVPCSGGSASQISVRRVSLSANGSMVGSVACAQFDAAVGEALEYPAGWSLGPDGKLLLTVRNTTDLQQPRMVLVDPATLAMSPYASNGPYPGAFATLAGVYSHVLDKAVILDSGNDVLRTFARNETGAGTVLATGVSWSQWSSEFAHLLEIGPASDGSGLTASGGSISVLGGGTQHLTFAPGAAHAGETYVIAGSAGGWWPGFLNSGFLIPLQWDFYTDYSLANANGPVLQNTFGVLGGAGQATGHVVFSPNMVPGVAGLTVYHAAVALNGGSLVFVSNPVPLTFTP